MVVLQFKKFVIVGIAGFVIDYGLSLVLTKSTANPYISRIAGFVVAVLFTYIANSVYTFKSHRFNFEEFAGYLFFTVASFLVNYLVFSLLVSSTGFTLAFIAGTGLSMFLNFTFYRRFVFTG